MTEKSSGLEAALETLERDPTDPAAHLAAARAHLARGSAVAAAGHLSQAEREGLEAPRDWLALGEAHLGAGRFRPSLTALERALLGLPGEPGVRRLHASAWESHLAEGGKPPPPSRPAIPRRRAEVALFALACRPWDPVGSCLAHFVAHLLADALEGRRPACTVAGGKTGLRRSSPEPPDQSLRAAVAARTGAKLGAWGEISLHGDPFLLIRVEGLLDGVELMEHRVRLVDGRLAEAVAQAIGRALEVLLPSRLARRGRQARAARGDLKRLAALTDQTLLDMVVLAEAGPRGRLELARRVANAGGGEGVTRAIALRAARSLLPAAPEAAQSLAEALTEGSPKDLEALLLLGEARALCQSDEARPLLRRVADEATGGMSADAWAALGRLDLEQGRIEEASAGARRALDVDPEHGTANCVAAALCEREDDLEGMERHLVAGLARLPPREREREVDAAAGPLLSAGRREGLMRIAAAATQDGTNTPTLAAAYAAGALGESSGCLRRAAVLLEPHLEARLAEEERDAIHSLFIETSSKLGAAAFRAGDHVDALRRFERVLEIDPEHAPARLAAAEMLLSLGRPGEAHGLLCDPAASSAGPMACALRALALLAMDRREEALIQAREAGSVALSHPELTALLNSAGAER